MLSQATFKQSHHFTYMYHHITLSHHHIFQILYILLLLTARISSVPLFLIQSNTVSFFCIATFIPYFLKQFYIFCLLSRFHYHLNISNTHTHTEVTLLLKLFRAKFKLITAILCSIESNDSVEIIESDKNLLSSL